MPDLIVYDIVTVERRVEVPAACPGCLGRFDGNDTAMVLWELQDQSRVAFFDSIDTIDYADQRPSQGEQYYELEYRCQNCGVVVAEGQHIDLALEIERAMQRVSQIDKAIAWLTALRAEVTGVPADRPGA